MNIKQVAGIAVILILCSFSALASGGSSKGIPDEIPATVPDGPLTWVAADVAITPEGKLRTDKVGNGTVAILGDFRASQQRRPAGTLRIHGEPDCGGYGTTLPVVEHYDPHDSFADLTRHAADVVAGRVIETRQGFFRGSPASLVRIEVTERYRRSGKLTIRDEVFLAYPYAKLFVDGSIHCARPVGFLFAPRPGDRVLIFSYIDGVGPNAAIINADPAREVIFERDGLLLVPPPLRMDAVIGSAQSFDALLRATANAVADHDRRLPERSR